MKRLSESERSRIRDARDAALTMAEIANTEEKKRRWTLAAAAHQKDLDDDAEGKL